MSTPKFKIIFNGAYGEEEEDCNFVIDLAFKVGNLRDSGAGKIMIYKYNRGDWKEMDYELKTSYRIILKKKVNHD